MSEKDLAWRLARLEARGEIGRLVSGERFPHPGPSGA